MNFLQAFIQRFESFRDQFIPEELEGADLLEKRYRFQLLAGMLIITIVLITLFNLHYLLLSNMRFPGSLIALVLSGSLGVYSYYLLKKLKHQLDPKKPSSSFVAATFTAICIGVFLTGGALDNATTYFLTIPITLGFLLCGRNIGSLFATLSFSYFLLIAYLESQGMNMPQTIPIKHFASIEVALWLFFFGAVFSFSIAYDHITYNLMSERKYQQEKQTYFATHDSMTGLANRHKFDQALDESLSRAKRLNKQLGLYLIDLDGFKPINDQFGHDAGDALLIHIAKKIQETLRVDDLACRLGGDEFAVITLGDVKDQDSEHLCQRLLDAIGEAITFNGNTLQVTASIGVSTYPIDGLDKESLLKAADVAMYRCKGTKQRWSLAY